MGSLSDAPGNLRGADLSKAIDLDSYQGYGYDKQNRGYDSYGGGDSKSSLLISFLVPIVVLICVCCCVVQLIRCFCGEICGGNMDPMLGAGLGAVAGYEMGQYMDGQGGYGGFGQQPMY